MRPLAQHFLLAIPKSTPTLAPSVSKERQEATPCSQQHTAACALILASKSAMVLSLSSSNNKHKYIFSSEYHTFAQTFTQAGLLNLALFQHSLVLTILLQLCSRNLTLVFGQSPFHHRPRCNHTASRESSSHPWHTNVRASRSRNCLLHLAINSSRFFSI